MWRRFALGILIFLVWTPLVAASERWICVRSANFELYTDSDEKSGKEALVFFEQVRRAFTENLGIKLPDNRPVTIIAFRDKDAFALYRPQDTAAAFTMSMADREIMVMQDLVPEHYPIALHEYTHVIIAQAGIKLPLWLNEGFAEVFATLKSAGRKILVGRIIPGRLQLAQAGLVDLHEVLNADGRSALYHENDRVGIFYAESWALVHMLKFSDAYSKQFDRVLDLIGNGTPSDQALQTVYGKTIEQIQADLAIYVHGARFREGVINAKLEKTGAEPKPVPADPLEVGVFLAEIQARGPHRHEALIALEDLAKANPGKPAPIEAIAWLQLSGPNPESAVVPFRRAVEAGTRDANLCFQYAVKLRRAIPDADYVAALRLATEIDPGFSAAQQQLAAHAFNAHDYAEAVKRLHLVKKLDRGHAFMYYRALSYAAFQTGDADEAKSAATRAQQYAVAPEDKRMADEMLQYVTSGKPAANAPGFNGNPIPQQ